MKERTWAVLGLMIVLPAFAVGAPILFVLNDTATAFSGLEFSGRTYSGSFVLGRLADTYPSDGMGGLTGAPFIDNQTVAENFADSVIDLVNTDGRVTQFGTTPRSSLTSFRMPLLEFVSNLNPIVRLGSYSFNGSTLVAGSTTDERYRNGSQTMFLTVTDTGAATSAAVPEPSTFALLFFATAALVIGKRRFPRSEEVAV